MASSSSIFFFFFSFLLWFSFPLRVNSQGSPAAAGDLAVLLQMKEDWGNPSSLSSWKRNTSHCTDWAGVVCSAGGDVVTKINLRSLGIKGKVPAVVCDLRNLSPSTFPITGSAASSPSLSTTAPNSVASISPTTCSSARSPLPRLALRPGGPRPLLQQFLRRCPAGGSEDPRLRQLFLDNNLFNGTFPKGLGSLEELETSPSPPTPSYPLRSGGYRSSKTSIFTTTSSPARSSARGDSFPNLTEVDLSMNHFTGKIPPDFGRQSNLQILFLYKNQLSGRIPEDIGKIPAMRDLRLFENNLTGGIPPEMGKYSKLLNFEVWSNGLSGELPEGLCTGGPWTAGVPGELPAVAGSASLRQLLLRRGTPRDLVSEESLHRDHDGEHVLREVAGRLPPSLSRLEIENNRFSGEVPSSAPGMMVFKASNNFFFGEITPDLTGMTLLQELLLEGNQIFGKIPAGIKVLKSLTNLILRSNQLSGEIPREIGSLPVLTSLDLSENRLSGEIPKELGKLKLNFLNLSGNHLSGEIPAALQNQAYESSFLSNPGICSSTSFLNLPPCTANSGGGSGKLDRRRRRKNQEDLAASWKLTSFQSLNFSESNILRGVAAGNVIGGGGSGEVYRVSLGNRAGGGGGEEAAEQREDRRQSGEGIRCRGEDPRFHQARQHRQAPLLHLRRGRQASGLRVHGERTPAMGWPARLSAAVGAARGLCYMHDECSPAIVHRDVKSSNILLDSGFQPKVADFGLARILGTAGEQDAGGGGATAASSLCAYSRKLNEKVDVYSFGVVLLELTTAGGRTTREWRRFQEGGAVEEALDPRIREPRYLEEIAVVYQLGLICTGTLPSTRPTMRDVLQVLLRCEQKHGDMEKKQLQVHGDDGRRCWGTPPRRRVTGRSSSPAAATKMMKTPSRSNKNLWSNTFLTSVPSSVRVLTTLTHYVTEFIYI
ncbi:unnamed protein product [Spirodela intermedia]|uniref:Protein kinase domain-containing protein n=1 Tax=Spirodela intermedia TaxID=51605 RepID=A0A7I8JDX1_SPIIN|nr:unnamed protein product [Spirodela intermedia]CAA6667945.1 unnamed protein product [Spirodela intermedia]